MSRKNLATLFVIGALVWLLIHFAAIAYIALFGQFLANQEAGAGSLTFAIVLLSGAIINYAE